MVMMMDDDDDTTDGIKLSMRQKEPQAGDASARAIDRKRKQAEAAGVYSREKAMPLRVDSPAGIDLTGDKDPEEAAFGYNIEEERDDPADQERMLTAIGKIGSGNEALNLTRQRRELRKRNDSARRRGRSSGGGRGRGPGGEPPEPLGPGAINTSIYKKHLPGHLEGDALKAAAEDAAKKQFDDKFAGKDPITQESVGVDDENWDKVTYDEGEVFLVSPTGAHVLRLENVKKPTTSQILRDQTGKPLPVKSINITPTTTVQ
jgi:hypothetical protein